MWDRNPTTQWENRAEENKVNEECLSDCSSWELIQIPNTEFKLSILKQFYRLLIIDVLEKGFMSQLQLLLLSSLPSFFTALAL